MKTFVKYKSIILERLEGGIFYRVDFTAEENGVLFDDAIQISHEDANFGIVESMICEKIETDLQGVLTFTYQNDIDELMVNERFFIEMMDAIGVLLFLNIKPQFIMLNGKKVLVCPSNFNLTEIDTIHEYGVYMAGLIQQRINDVNYKQDLQTNE